MSWQSRPTILDYWPEGVEYMMFVDENNSSSLRNIRRTLRTKQQVALNDKYFTVTGCVLNREDYPSIRWNIQALKNKYWEDGLYFFEKEQRYKRVCFISHDIRNRRGPFSLQENEYKEFITDLSTFLTNLHCVIFSVTINKEEHCRRYVDPDHPYHLSIDFILERYGKFFLRTQNAKGIVLLEARGRKDDKRLLDHFRNKLTFGTRYAIARELRNISGVYFNSKWSSKHTDLASHFGLEIADLFSFSIHKFCRSGCSVKDAAFNVTELKLYGYPDYFGHGLKIFP